MTSTAPAPSIVLQITDIHLRAADGDTLLGVNTWDSVAAVVDQALAERRPDALLVTGDIAHDPLPDLYLAFHRWLQDRYDGPLLALPGNHDVLGNMGPLASRDRLLLPGWHIVALDSHVDNEPQALVSDADLAVLEAACADAGGEHVLVATHHPPVEIGCPWLDKDRIQNGLELLEWMAEHSTVKAMVFGHAHQELEFTHRHLRLLGTPSTCIQFEPGSRTFAVDERKPGYRWLELWADGTVTSRVRRVEDYPLTIDRTAFKPA